MWGPVVRWARGNPQDSPFRWGIRLTFAAGQQVPAGHRGSISDRWIREPGSEIEHLTLKIPLAQFARARVEACYGPDVAAGVRAALLSYACRLQSDSPPVPFPHFRRGEQPDRVTTSIELAVEPTVASALEREADRQAVSMEQLLAHAVIVHVA